MSDYAFFEFRATITNLTHDESEGESVHCLSSGKLRGPSLPKVDLRASKRLKRTEPDFSQIFKLVKSPPLAGRLGSDAALISGCC
jgi:hypothetical protein